MTNHPCRPDPWRVMNVTDAALSRPNAASSRRTHVDATAREREREALRRYVAAVVAARESLRRAEERFAASSDAIDRYIERALAAEARRGIPFPAEVAASSTAAPSSSARRAAERTRHGTARRRLALVPLRPGAR